MATTRCRRTRNFLLYHWAPVERRASILKRGLLTRQAHTAHSPGWQAPYLCFSDSPSYAWALSAGTQKTIKEWDLWMVWSKTIPDLYYRGDEVGRNPAEYRTKKPVSRTRLWHVGTRKSN